MTRIFILFCAFLPLSAIAQLERNLGSFDYYLDVTRYAGMPFRVTAAARVQRLDSTAQAALWVLFTNQDKKRGTYYQEKDHPIRDSAWKIYTLEGKVDKDAKFIYLGGIYYRKAYFYFDDFHLYIQTSGSTWSEIGLSDGDFEGDSASFNHNWKFSRFRNQRFFTPFLTTESPYEGRQAMKIDGTQPFIFDYYGNNDTAGHFITANGIRLYYEIYGQGEPLLLLHGNSSSIVSYEHQIPELSKHFRVIAVDTRGQGRSGEDGKTYTYDLFAEDMNAFLDSLHLDSVNVLGWSDGGNTGLIMAMKYPRKVRRLATMGANIFIDRTAVEPIVWKYIREDQKEVAGDTSAKARNRVRLLNMLVTEPRHRFDELTAIHCPVLVMAGEHDLIKKGHTQQIAAHIAGSRLVIFPGGKHEEPADHPDVFNKTVEDFFSTN